MHSCLCCLLYALFLQLSSNKYYVRCASVSSKFTLSFWENILGNTVQQPKNYSGQNLPTNREKGNASTVATHCPVAFLFINTKDVSILPLLWDTSSWPSSRYKENNPWNHQATNQVPTPYRSPATHQQLSPSLQKEKGPVLALHQAVWCHPIFANSHPSADSEAIWNARPTFAILTISLRIVLIHPLYKRDISLLSSVHRQSAPMNKICDRHLYRYNLVFALIVHPTSYFQ